MGKMISMDQIRCICKNHPLIAANGIISSLGIIHNIKLTDYPAFVRLILASTQDELVYRYYTACLVDCVYLKENNQNNIDDDITPLLNAFNEFDEESKKICKAFIRDYFSEYEKTVFEKLGIGEDKK